MPLSDTHLVLLSAASQRDDGLLPRPDRMAGAALHNLAASLIKADAAALVPVQADQPHWRNDDDGHPIGLRITPAGLSAIGIDAEHEDGSGSVSASGSSATIDQPSTPVPPGAANQTGGDRRQGSAKAPRPGTKLASLVAQLTREEGATLDALMSTTGWQPHTVRAALTRLRQSGRLIIKSKDDQERTTYRIASGQNGAA